MSESEERTTGNWAFRVMYAGQAVAGATTLADAVTLLAAIFQRTGYDLDVVDQTGTVVATIMR